MIINEDEDFNNDKSSFKKTKKIIKTKATLKNK